MPGYLRDMSPVEFDTFEEAKAHVLSEIEGEFDAKQVNWGALEDALAFVEAQTGPFSVTIRDRAYWVAAKQAAYC